MKKICIFCETWESGGIESFINAVLMSGNMSFMKIDIVVSEIRTSVFTANLEKMGIQFYSLSGNTRSIVQNIKKFGAHLKKQKYDLIHFNIYHGVSMVYAQVAALCKVPVRIIHSHNTDLRKSFFRPLKIIFHKIASQMLTKYATDLWACSTLAAKFMFPERYLARGDIMIIPNGIDTARFVFNPCKRSEIRRQLGVEDCFVVGNIGRICYQKNQSFLIEVMSEVLKIKPKSVLLLIGDGEEHEMIKLRAENMGIQDHVIFYGNSTKVEELFWAMDTFAFPSLFEGFGIVSIEAQASGLPVICSEFVPRETYLTPSVKAVPISSGSRKWAEQLLNSKTLETRCDAALSIKKAGYDIVDVVKKVKKCYVESVNIAHKC